VQIGAVELHPWNASVDDTEHPDRLVFDLDPGVGIAWSFVIDTALQLRDLLKREGLQSWPKVTGGKGIYLMVPVETLMTHDQAHRYAPAIAQRLGRTDPDRYIVSAAMTKRGGTFVHRLPAQRPRQHGDWHVLATDAAGFPDRRAGEVEGRGEWYRSGCVYHEKSVPEAERCVLTGWNGLDCSQAMEREDQSMADGTAEAKAAKLSRLALHTTGTVHDNNTLRYRASKFDCDVCALKMQCCPNTPARQIPRDIHEDARNLARRLMGTKRFLKSRDEGKRVEMRFAHLKIHHGFERMRLRGLSGARDEFHLAAIVQNLKTLALRS
jgi:hypothetical protein